MKPQPRRQFLRASTLGLGAWALESATHLVAQPAGERPPRPASVTVLNPRSRVPVGILIDDSTCLVNLNRFAMPQFDLAHDGANPVYHKPWRDWPVEIPDAFVRRFGEWAAAQGVKGKYSIVPYPACVGRLDRLLPGWTQRELDESLELVRTVLAPNWDLHPEMVTHTRVIDLRTGHPYPETSMAFMENWDWTTGKSADELTAYLVYALEILRNAGLPVTGITTPGGFASRARPQFAQAVLQAMRGVFQTEIPHYFQDLHDAGDASVAPRVELATGLDTSDPRCVVSLVGCTGDWTGGWDCVTPEGADRFITADLTQGRLVEVIQRGEPALMLSHWTGVYWNGQELGFRIYQEVVRRLHARFEHLLWMKPADLARYWAARELTRIEVQDERLRLHAPFACPDFTLQLQLAASAPRAPRLRIGPQIKPLREVDRPIRLTTGTWFRDPQGLLACVDLPKGDSTLDWGTA